MRNTLIKSKNKDGYGISLEELERRLGTDLSHLRPPAAKEDTALTEASVLEGLAYFERLKASQLDPLWQVNRRGRPADFSKNQSKMCADQHTLRGRIGDFIRKKYGLGGKDKCKQAEAILEKGREDLMQAVESGVLAMAEAYDLLMTCPATTAVLLLQGKSVIKGFLKKQREAKAQAEEAEYEMLTETH